MKIFKYIVVFCLFTCMSYAQLNTVQDTLLAAQYYKKADSMLVEKNIEKSLVYFQKALPIYEKAKSWQRLASCYNGISEVYSRSRILEKSFDNATKALQIANEYLSDDNIEKLTAYNKLGAYHYDKFNFSLAIDFYQKIFKYEESRTKHYNTQLITSYTGIGNCFYGLGDYDKSIQYYKKGIEVIIENFGENSIYLADNYGNISSAYKDIGEYEKALIFQKKALNIRQEFFGKNHFFVASNYNNMGTIYTQQESYIKALEYFNKSRILNENRYGKDNYRQIGTYHNIGIVYHKMKDYEVALQYYSKGLKMILDKFGDQHMFAAHSYNNIGKTYEEIGQYEIALDYYTKSHTIYENKLGVKSLRTSNAYNYTALAYTKDRQYDKALLYYDKAILANLKKGNDVDKFDANNFLGLNKLLISLEGKSTVLLNKYKDTKSSENINKLLDLYQKIDQLIFALRNKSHNYGDKLAIAKNVKKVYRGAIETQLLRQQNINDSKVLNNAFEYAEKSKANTLKDLIKDSKAKNFSRLPTSLIEIEKEIKRNKAFYQSKINKELSKKIIDSVQLSGFENKFFEISRRQDSLTEVLEKKYPKYHQLKYSNKVVTVPKVQQQLNEKTTVLEFFTTDSVTYAFVVSKNKVAVTKLSAPKLEEQIEILRASVIDKNTKAYKSIAYELYQKLIVPVQEQLVGDQLIIVPDGPLWHLNFELLLTEFDMSNNPKKLSYLLKNYVISYANSATLVFSENKENNNDTKNQEECLAFSFSDITSSIVSKNMSLATLRDTGDDLPGTRKEIKAIADIIDGQYFYGNEAIETNFKKNASNYKILHLALHGEVDNQKPENSKLFFTKSVDTLNDNMLYSHELFALDIPAELTVLSACNTGVGKIAKGEGIISLGTAFQYAGTKSLVLSSWEVSDQTTPILMKYFYGNLKAGMNKAKALQQAKLSYLDTAIPQRTHPFYWAGFYLVGDTNPIDFNMNNYVYWFLGIGILVSILLSLFWCRKRIQN